MPKRKTHPKLPSGWGSIRYLGKGRRNPYAVHPPCTEVDVERGRYIRPKALCYVSNWYVGFAVLNAYRAGTYQPGDEVELERAIQREEQSDQLDTLVTRILGDYGRWSGSVIQEKLPTFQDVYGQYFEWKFGPKAPKKLSASRVSIIKMAYKATESVYDRVFKDISLDELQRIINESKLAKGSLAHVRTFLVELYDFAESRDICAKNIAKKLVIPADAKEEEHGVPFSIADLHRLWEDIDNPVSEMLIIMCYSGYRISAYQTMEVHLKEAYFHGGVKTAAGKDRNVPIHSAILPLVKKRLSRDKRMMGVPTTFRAQMSARLAHLGIEAHTPHDCRHTFSALCEKFKVSEADRKRMLGHSFGADLTNGVYGHRTVDELREEIEKIPSPDKLPL